MIESTNLKPQPKIAMKILLQNVRKRSQEFRVSFQLKPIAVLLMLSMILTSSTLFSQERRITGRVVAGDNNIPLAGVSVQVRGTSIGTTTDVNGAYSINASNGATLTFGYVGYVQQEVTVGESNSINVTLATTNAALNEVVVIGYQTVRKRDLTGATSVVNAQNTQRLASRSLPEQLQGMAAGVNVRTGGAQVRKP